MSVAEAEVSSSMQLDPHDIQQIRCFFNVCAVQAEYVLLHGGLAWARLLQVTN